MSAAEFHRRDRGIIYFPSFLGLSLDTWLGCTSSITVASYLIASGIPIFNTLVSLIGALLRTLMSYQPMDCMWLYDNWKDGRDRPTLKWFLLSAWSIFVNVLGTFLVVAGTYGSVFSIIEASKTASGSSAWSCSDNSNSWCLSFLTITSAYTLLTTVFVVHAIQIRHHYNSTTGTFQILAYIGSHPTLIDIYFCTDDHYQISSPPALWILHES